MSISDLLESIRETLIVEAKGKAWKQGSDLHIIAPIHITSDPEGLEEALEKAMTVANRKLRGSGVSLDLQMTELEEEGNWGLAVSVLKKA